MKASKRFKVLEVPTDPQGIEQAVTLVKKNATSKFDETIEASFNLNLLKKHTVRDTIVYPHPFGKLPRVLVFSKGDKADMAKAAGADHVGADDLVEKISGGWLEFDVTIATPDMMKTIAKIARILGTKGLMPNPKAKTVTEDVKSAVEAIKAGRREFRANNEGVLNFSVGKASMETNLIVENYKVLYEAVQKKKPMDLKGDYILSLHLSSTMGRGVKLEHKKLF